MDHKGERAVGPYLAKTRVSCAVFPSVPPCKFTVAASGVARHTAILSLNGVAQLVATQNAMWSLDSPKSIIRL